MMDIYNKKINKSTNDAQLSPTESNTDSPVQESVTHTSSCDTGFLFKTKINKIKKSVNDKDKMIKKLLQRQLNNIPIEQKLMFKDMKRICKNIISDMFDVKKCCIWQGHVTNVDKNEKGKYVNFYFCGKKRALHRLLYSNFTDRLANDEYLKFTCKNKGICCNVNHLKKFKYSDADLLSDEDDNNTETTNNVVNTKYSMVIKKSKNNKFTLTFG